MPPHACAPVSVCGKYIMRDLFMQILRSAMTCLRHLVAITLWMFLHFWVLQPDSLAVYHNVIMMRGIP